MSAPAAVLVRAISLPPDAEQPIQVYVNGEPWAEGTDFVVDGDALRFKRPLHAAPKLGTGRKLMLAMGIGVYGDLKGDTLDLQYQRAGIAQSMSIRLKAADVAP